MEITPKAMEIEYIRIKRFNQEIEKVYAMDQKKTAELNLEEILLTGFARLPEKSVLFSKYNGTIGVTLLVNRSTGKILEVASEDFSPLQINYFNKLLRGEEISTEDGMFRIEQLLARNYQSSLRKPFYSGIRACRQKLEELREDDIRRMLPFSQED